MKKKKEEEIGKERRRRISSSCSIQRESEEEKKWISSLTGINNFFTFSKLVIPHLSSLNSNKIEPSKGMQKKRE